MRGLRSAQGGKSRILRRRHHLVRGVGRESV